LQRAWNQGEQMGLWKKDQNVAPPIFVQINTQLSQSKKIGK
jgi:hypothetical protein